MGVDHIRSARGEVERKNDPESGVVYDCLYFWVNPDLMPEEPELAKSFNNSGQLVTSAIILDWNDHVPSVIEKLDKGLVYLYASFGIWRKTGSRRGRIGCGIDRAG